MDLTDAKAILASAIEGMPRIHQQVLSLYYIDDLTLAEIAEVLDLSPLQVYRLYLEAASQLPSLMR